MNLEPVIADFGLSKILAQDETTVPVSCMVGTCQWMAPELLDANLLQSPDDRTLDDSNTTGAQSYNSKVDVYSFAVVLWEILSGQPPYGGFANQFQVFLFFALLVMTVSYCFGRSRAMY